MFGRRKRRGRRAAVLLVVLLVAAGAYLDFRVRRGFADGRWVAPVRFLAAPSVIVPGMDVAELELESRLGRLGYREVDHGEPRPGEYSHGPDFLEIHRRALPQPAAFLDEPPRRVRLVLEGDEIRLLRDVASGERLTELVLEPAPIEGVLGDHWTRRESFALEDVPPHMIDALLAAEDAHFLDHPGINLRSMARALKANLEAGRIRQGGSTLTQQFVKNHFLTQERTFARKLLEIPMALVLEARFSKEEILEAYVATVYLGHDRLVGVHGLAEGARAYLGKPLAELTVADGALLAGLIRAPNIYSPLRHPERARKRRDQVLGEMRDLGWIDDETWIRALREPIVQPPSRQSSPAAFFVQEAVRELERRGTPVGRLGTGSEVFTTLDAELQGIAYEEARRLAARRPGLEVEVVALDPDSGALRALVGGRDFLASQLDRTQREHGPAGSIFKPFLLLAAFAAEPAGITPETRLLDSEITIDLPGGDWTPRNSDGRYRGEVTLREALYRSLNVPMVRLAQRLGVEEVAIFADSLGLSAKPLPRVPSLALGAFPASLRRITAAYSIFSGGGRAVEPFAVRAVKAPSGAILLETDPQAEAVVGPAAAREVHDLLVDVAEEGTARQVARAGVASAVAGKTGTTNETRDLWFVGYTPELLVGVRLAYPDRRPIGADAAQLAVPLWSRIVARAEAGRPARSAWQTSTAAGP